LRQGKIYFIRRRASLPGSAAKEQRCGGKKSNSRREFKGKKYQQHGG